MNELDQAIADLETFAIRSVVALSLALVALIAWAAVLLGNWMTR